MQCLRCFSFRLLQLDKKRAQDNYVFRCQECGFIFSPGSAPSGEARNNVAAAPSGRTSPAAPAEAGSPGESSR